MGLASAQLVLPAFGAALRDLDLVECLDQELGAFLEAVHAANRERNAEVRDELVAVVGILNRADIQPVLLKGRSGCSTDSILTPDGACCAISTC